MRGKPYAPIRSYPLPLGFNGRWAWLWRWFSGRPMSGHRFTDATGFRYGTKAVDISGHASSFQLLPGYKRFLYVRLPVMVAPPYVIACVLWPWSMAVVSTLLVLLAIWRADRWRRVRTFRRQVVEPVAAGVSAVLKVDRIVGQGHRVVDIPRDFRDRDEAKIIVKLPHEWIGQEGDKTRLVQVVSSRINVEELDASWTFHGGHPHVTLSIPPKPPASVLLADVQAMAEAVEDTSIMLGIGARGKREDLSLIMESPHFLLAAASGAGKSEFLAFLVAQLMRRGFGIGVADAKFTSLMWLRRIPGVLYASESEDLHNFLIWLDQELLRRARIVSSSPDTEKAAASLTPIAVILEEINGASNRLRSYWRSIRSNNDPIMSPALTALGNLANMGREMRVHVFMVGQSVTAKSTGGPEGRESFGARALARATAKQWAMLAPQIKPAPVKRNRPGRWHIVVGDTVREFQVPLCDIKNNEGERRLIQWATSGAPVPDLVAIMAGEEQPVRTENPRSEAAPPSVSLSDYATARGVDKQWLRRQIERRPEAPASCDTGPNNTRLYTWEALDAFVAQRLREPAEVDE